MSLEYFKNEIINNKTYLTDMINALENRNNQDAKIGIIGAKNLLESIDYVEKGLVANPQLIMDLIFPNKARMGVIKPVNFYDKHIDETQGLAVKKALAMENLLVIQGPPGAGKSTTIVEMIRQILARDSKIKILVSSQTHIAVDSVMEKLIDNGFKNIVRLDSKTRESNNEKLKDVYYSSQFNHYANSAIGDLKNYIDNHAYTINRKSDKNRSITIGGNTISDACLKSIIMSRNVIGVTANALKNTRLKVSDRIDYAIVDEVGKLTFSELMFVARFAKKMILIGDPNQLPSVLFQFGEGETYSKEAYRYMEVKPFINALFNNVNKYCKVFLNTQYRMAREIGNYISDCFYNYPSFKLKNGVTTVSNPDALNFVDYDRNKCLVGIRHTSNQEEMGKKELSNTFELEIVKCILKRCEENGLNIYDDVAIISPYAAQVKLLKDSIPKIKVDTVDAYQGREAKVVIFTCARNQNVTSFFQKTNRINVAISRAIKEIWIVGSKEFCNEVAYLKKYIDYNITDDDGLKCKCNHYYYDNEEIKKS